MTLQKEQSAVDFFFRIAFIVWIGLIFILAGISCWSSYVTQVRIIKNSVLESFKKDTVYRYWATQHGGVYVPVTPETQPNPYLAHLPERDIVTPSGKKLTLVNPAYMTRQVHALGLKRYGLRGHITSLKPIRPENKPDAWEREALLSFEKGNQEVFESARIDGDVYFRFMHPFITEKGCLKCHAEQGYREGDIRGGISVSVPWEPVSRELFYNFAVICAAYLILGCAGFLGLRLGYRRIKGHLLKRLILERTLEHKNDELIGFNRMVMHDLKSPLVTIRAHAEFLEQDIAAGNAEHIKKSLHFIGTAAESMNSLVEELLVMSQIEQAAFSFDDVPLQELACEVLELTAGCIKLRNVRVKVCDTPFVLYGDRFFLVRVLQNLIDNAVKFMGDQPEPRIDITAAEYGSSVCVSVCDNGMGIDSQKIDTIFEAFIKLNSTCEGFGLGLALVKRIVEMHGGSVWVESEGIGRGSCFRFTLPMKVKE